MSQLAQNLRFLRNSRGWSQKRMADALALTRGKWGSYEEDRAKPPIDTLAEVAAFFDLTLDQLVQTPLSEVQYLGEAAVPDEHVPGAALPEGLKGIEIVSHLVQAGYLAGYQDSEYVRDLTQLYLPKQMLGPGTFRAFQITGYSMLPLQPGTIVIGRKTEPDYIIGTGKQTYVLITRDDGIVFKRVLDSQPTHLVLRSDNPEYEDYTVDKTHILEAWEARMFISSEMP